MVTDESGTEVLDEDFLVGDLDLELGDSFFVLVRHEGIDTINFWSVSC